jgi:predicted phosphohydrolase
MIVQYASDLHLEFTENKAYLDLHPLQPVGNVLILAGDIVPFAFINQHTDFFSYLSDHFETSYWIPGNHEYYHFDLATKSGILYEKIRSNVFLINNKSIVYKNVEFIFSTLWSKISSENENKLLQAMNDFRLIKYDHQQFKPQQLNDMNQESVEFLTKELYVPSTLKRVVVTHHVPTFKNAPVKYRGSVMHEVMGLELSDLIEKTKPDYWIYGHIHRNNPDFKIGKTMMMTNQMGYVMKGEQNGFNACKTIIVSN